MTDEKKPQPVAPEFTVLLDPEQARREGRVERPATPEEIEEMMSTPGAQEVARDLQERGEVEKD